MRKKVIWFCAVVVLLTVAIGVRVWRKPVQIQIAAQSSAATVQTETSVPVAPGPKSTNRVTVEYHVEPVIR